MRKLVFLNDLQMSKLQVTALVLLVSPLVQVQAQMPIQASSHAPIGVMGDHRHQQSETMFSYRFMDMNMTDNLQGSDSISPTEIVSTTPNAFAPPPTLRVVPIEMNTQVHMFGAMYAPIDSLTLMAMANYLEKSMDHITFQGGAGTTELGRFTTRNTGLGDVKLAGLVKLLESETQNWHLNLGLSLPTGSIDATDRVLTPSGATPELRLPYGMQLGSGTYDLEPGITYTGKSDQLGWGSQLRSIVHLGENDENYTFGDSHQLTSWASFSFSPAVSVSSRLTYQLSAGIDGRDQRIAAPVQTADPANYGREALLLGFGINTAGQSDGWRGHRLALEVSTPLMQDVKGVQLEMDTMITAGYQYTL